MAAAQRIQQWRWLIIDEISMVSSNLLAELDAHLRSVMSGCRQGKGGADGVDRPFGGVIIVFCGDFYQLEPPGGAPLNAIPTS